jgi:predicted CoA-binding protein
VDHTVDEENLEQFFSTIKTIAVVGYSDKEERAGHYVAHYLADSGYEVIAINPKFGEAVNGLPCYANLGAVPQGYKINVIDVFRSPPFVPDLVRQAIQMDPKPDYIVMQPGAESEEAAELAQEHGIKPLMICMMAAHKIWK